MILSVPAGPWAVGVSGGADSVALVRLLHERSDLALHTVHLNHETRGEENALDAQFVADLAAELKLPYTIARRSEIELKLSDLPANPSARYRALRLALFADVVEKQQLRGVILAHHADDQAETILHRLLRGSGYTGLAGMTFQAHVAGLTILRPLLAIRRSTLREFLMQHQFTWREDPSNQSDQYFRNVLRQLLAAHPGLIDELLLLGRSCAELRDWAHASAPVLDEQFRAAELADLPLILAEQSARRWLIERGVPPDQLDPLSIQRLMEMASDAASAPRQDFPAAVRVHRRRGVITAET